MPWLQTIYDRYKSFDLKVVGLTTVNRSATVAWGTCPNGGCGNCFSHIAATTGIAIAFPVPLNAYSPVLIAGIFVLWMCNDCGPSYNTPVCFDVYPSSGYLRAVRWPDLELIYATSETALICPAGPPWPICAELPIPVEQTTWGHIKAMYH